MNELSSDINLSLSQQHEDKAHDAFEKLIAEKKHLTKQINADKLNEQLQIYEEYAAHASAAYQLAQTIFMADTTQDAARDFLARLEAKNTKRSTKLLYFTLTLKSWGEERLKELASQLPQYETYLERVAESARYTLSEREEKAIMLKEKGGSDAVDKIFETLTSSFAYEIQGETISRGELSRFFTHKDRAMRKKAREALLVPYDKNNRVMQEIYRAVVLDGEAESVELRGFENPLAARLFGDETDKEVFDALMQVYHERQEVFRRYIKLKQKALGYEEFTRYDFSAPVDGLPEDIDFEVAKQTVLESMKGFANWMGEVGEELIRNGRVDAQGRQGKVSGAWCFLMSTKEDPVLMQSYNNNYDSMSTLAHELGHAIHSKLSQHNNQLNFSPQTTIAETASTFSEQLLLSHVLDGANKQEKIALLCQAIDDSLGSIQAQLRYTEFEIEAHNHIIEGKSISELNTKWVETLKRDFPSVDWPETSFVWATIPHFFQMPFYCYSYAYGQLLSLALYQSFKEEPEKARKSIKSILEAGGSKKPTQLLAKQGYDITSKEFWNKGYDSIEKQVDLLESIL